MMANGYHRAMDLGEQSDAGMSRFGNHVDTFMKRNRCRLRSVYGARELSNVWYYKHKLIFTTDVMKEYVNLIDDGSFCGRCSRLANRASAGGGFEKRAITVN